MKIAYGNSRMDKKWKNTDISWEDFCSRVKTTQRTTETVEEYRKMRKGGQDSIKDVGGFVGGHLKDGRRKKGNVLSRSMLTLDMDYGTSTIWEEISTFFPYQCCIYSTHKHTPENPRLRLIIPLFRDVGEEEYAAVSRMVAKEDASLSGENERINELIEFIRKNKFRTLEYDDKLVRKIIQSVTVYEDHFVIAFKSGIEMEI